jgi:hypothetical protein
MRVDHGEPKSELQAERVQNEYDGPQAPRCMDSNLAIGSMQAPVYSTITPCPLFWIWLYVIVGCALSW